MEPAEDWSGNCQPVESQTQDDENTKVIQLVPGYSTFDNYVQV